MFKRIALDNGLRIVCEQIPYVRSVSVGIWVGTGSRNETLENSGISHFIEHMLFKGTEKRSAKDIAESIDSIGGQINAFTGKECTCYYTKTLDTHIDIAFDVLADMFFNSAFAEKDIKVEKKVILEEIGMYEDSPEELVHDILSAVVWDGNPLGYSILGTSESLAGIDKKMISEYMKENYTPQNSVISIAGNFDEDVLIELVNKHFGSWKSGNASARNIQTANFVTGIKVKQKDTEQVHLCLGFNGLSQGHDDLYTLLAINNVFGGGMSSKLFQKIREEKGLVYSIYSYPSSYKNSGLFTIYAGMNPDQLPKVMGLIQTELEELVSKGLTADELDKSKEQLKGGYILGLESTSSRMNSIGKSELLLEKIFTPEEVLGKIDDIKMKNVNDVINNIFATKTISISAVGNIKNDVDFGSILKI